MKNNILKNITYDKIGGEKIVKEFRNLSAKGYLCQMVLTTKRLSIYSKAKVSIKGRKGKRKRMNEIDLNSVHRLEYYIDYERNGIILKLIGFLIFVISLYVGYLLYFGRIALPSSIPFQPYIKYVTTGILALIGLVIVFHVDKTLYLIINSGNNDKTMEKFVVNKYNELAVRYIASKLRVKY